MPNNENQEKFSTKKLIVDKKGMVIPQYFEEVEGGFHPNTNGEPLQVNSDDINNIYQELFSEKKMLVDQKGRPIPQFYNPQTEEFEPLTTEGSGGGGGGGGGVSPFAVLSINNILPDETGNVEVPIAYQLVPMFNPSTPPSSFSLGTSVLVFDYDPNENEEWLEILGPDVPAGKQLVITEAYPEEGVYIQRVDTQIDGFLDFSLTRVNVPGTNTWGPLINSRSVRSINGVRPDASGDINVPSGPVGPQGEKGDKGDTGTRGPVGPAGPKGDKGDIGLTGAQGPIGPEGPSGSDGDTGEPGPRGPEGPRGIQGVEGPIGPEGPRGPKGDRGEGFVVSATYYTIAEAIADLPNNNVQEMQFIAIVNGDDADENGNVYILEDGEYVFQFKTAGVQGEQGIEGPPGIQGPPGPEGPKGDVGPQGPTGPKGDKGEIGGAIRIRGTVANENALVNLTPPSGGFKNGDAYWTEEGRIYIWTDNNQLVSEPGWLRGPDLRGANGLNGLNGRDGRSINIRGNLEEEGALPTSGEPGDAFWIDNRLYIWSLSEEAAVEPSWVRGPNLRGAQGIRGLVGPKGEDAVIQDATTSQKGVVQVGTGLNVSNGLVSVDNGAISLTNLDVNAPLSDYPMGEVSRTISTSITNGNYLYLANVVKDLIGTDLANVGGGNYLRMDVTTLKTSTLSTQRVNVSTNYTGNFYPVFELYRSDSGGNWTAWKASVVENYGKGNPNGAISGIYGAKYTDVLTNKTYIKKGATNAASNSGWEDVSLKGYLYARRTSAVTLPSGTGTSARLVFNEHIKRGGIGYDNSTGYFTLEAGRTYNIRCSASFMGGGVGNWIEIGLYNLSGNAEVPNTSRGIYIAVNATNNEMSFGPLEIIYTPTTNFTGYIAATGKSGTITFRANSNYLVIQEI